MGIPEGGQTANKIAAVSYLVTTNEMTYALVQKVSSRSVILDHWLILRSLVQNRAACEDFLHQCSFRTNGEWLRTQEVRTNEDPGIKKNTEDAWNENSCLRACF